MIRKIFQIPERFSIKYWITIPIFVLLIISLLALYSTSGDVSPLKSSFYRQIIWIFLGVSVFVISQYIRIQYFYEYGYILFALLLVAILVTYAMPAIDGSKRWIFIGPLSFQPSEIGKLLTVFVLAKYLADQKDKIREVKVLFIAYTISIVPALMVFRQPDLGTALIYLAVVLPMLYWSGVRPLYLFLSVSPLISVVAAFNLTVFYIWMVLFCIVIFIGQPKIITGTIHFIINVGFGMLAPYIWNNVLYPHQKKRILTLLDPMSDPQGAGYQVLQSMTAIGSGGFWGKGLGNGTQTHLRFLPVRDTDFIISVIGEEMGLFAIMIILIAVAIMFYWLVGYARKVQNRFSSLVLIGFTVILFSHIIVNMGMVVGYFPVTGLPAPFLSYGGSFLLTCSLIIALANNIINSEI